MAQGGWTHVFKRLGWFAAILLVWPVWYLLYGVAFAAVNELLTQVPPLSAENGMLAPGFEIALQLVFAGIFGFLGMLLVRLVRGPKATWYMAGALSVALSVATFLLWRRSDAGAIADAGIRNSIATYLLAGSAMTLGCLLGASFPKRLGRTSP